MALKTQEQRELDQLEQLCMDLTVAQYKSVQQCWIDDSMAAAVGKVASFKDGVTPSVRFKAAGPGMTSVELPMGLASALATARANEGDAAIEALLKRVAAPGQQVNTGGQIRDGEKPRVAAKSVPLTPIQQVARATMPELYAEPKKGPKTR